jgi:hypothetical protein
MMFVFITIIVGLGILIGFIYWVLATGLIDYNTIWSIILLVFVAILLVGFYFTGKARIRA